MIAGIVFFCLAGVFVLAGIVLMRKMRRQTASGVNVEAKVTRKRQEGRKRAASVFALFEYEVEGKTYRQEFCVDTIVPPDVGSTLTIGYDPDNPERIYLRSGRGYMVFYIIAAVFAVVGIAMLITQ